MENYYEIRSQYRKGVLNTNWNYEELAYPMDYPNQNSKAHYKTFGSTTGHSIPKTTYQEQNENILDHEFQPTKGIRISTVNFTSYPTAEQFLAQLNSKPKQTDSDDEECLNGPRRTTYQRSYGICETEEPKPNDEIECKDTILHPLFNRRPKSEFMIMGPLAPNKFMDDHFHEIGENRKIINFLRQIRNRSYNPGTGKYQ